MKWWLSILTASCAITIGSADAQRIDSGKLKFFETHIRPALVNYCYKCHSVEGGDSRGGLLLDTRKGWVQGGDSGTAIVPGNPEESVLWQAINWDGYEMPPSKKMPADVIAKFKQWIEMGAPDPRERKLLVHRSKISKADIERGKKHWSFQPPRRQTGANIDELVSTKLEEAGLTLAPPADAYTLLRRINFDLIGLPPTTAEIREFQTAYERNSDAALKSKVDELLDRPQYGERWGRHWLDVARYAESSGSRNVSYPHAWRYRNYVFDSFNEDTPYDRFIAEQIAGDLLPVKSDEQWQKNLIATGFLAIGMKHHDEKNPRKFMGDMVDEQIDTTTQAVLGLTVSCARCHDHKYDPIPTADYYSLAGIFYSTKTYYGTVRVAQNHRPSELILLPIADASAESSRASQQTMTSLKARIAQLDRQLAGLRGKDRRQTRNLRNRVAARLAATNPDGTPKSFAMGVQEQPQKLDARILIAGEVEKPAQKVPRGFVQLFGDLNFTLKGNESSGRLQLVNALTSKENPLTARVMVNRIWMHLLGKPLVATPSNFGLSGMKPNNQELLDYLAVRFMDEDWSVKQMIREIVMSSTYRRSSRYNESNYAVDPDNKYLWRTNPRHIDAESMRDAMLALSGNLDLERPDYSASLQRRGRPGSRTRGTSETYRSVYLPIIRDGLPDSLDLFDFPDPNMTSAGRAQSIVPTQSLYLMNGEFVESQARGMAEALTGQHKERVDQIRAAFLLAYGRPATKEELSASLQFFRDFEPSRTGMVRASSQNRAGGRGRARGRFARAGRGVLRNQDNWENSAADQALAVFCQTLMASARFRILN